MSSPIAGNFNCETTQNSSNNATHEIMWHANIQNLHLITPPVRPVGLF
jgi:hypothetical protein